METKKRFSKAVLGKELWDRIDGIVQGQKFNLGNGSAQLKGVFLFGGRSETLTMTRGELDEMIRRAEWYGEVKGMQWVSEHFELTDAMNKEND